MNIGQPIILGVNDEHNIIIRQRSLQIIENLITQFLQIH